jgi:prepilin-type N-terminal cleavage/methylation domain-containing protein
MINMKTKGKSLIELIVVLALIGIAVLIGFSCAGQGGLASTWGRSLQLESVEGGPIKKWNWVDTNTGEKFFSYEADGDPLWRRE